MKLRISHKGHENTFANMYAGPKAQHCKYTNIFSKNYQQDFLGYLDTVFQFFAGSKPDYFNTL